MICDECVEICEDILEEELEEEEETGLQEQDIKILTVFQSLFSTLPVISLRVGTYRFIVLACVFRQLVLQ